MVGLPDQGLSLGTQHGLCTLQQALKGSHETPLDRVATLHCNLQQLEYWQVCHAGAVRKMAQTKELDLLGWGRATVSVMPQTLNPYPYS